MDVRMKAGGLSKASKVVTETDLKSQEIIRRILGPLSREYDLAFLGEEEEDDGGRFEKNYFFCVDPLDGTLSFTEGNSGYSVSIALVSSDGVPWLGVVYDPVRQQLLSALRGKPVFRPLPSDEVEALGDAPLLFYIDRSFSADARFPRVCSMLEEKAKKYRIPGIRVVSGQGAVLNACAVLGGSPSCYFKLPNPMPSGGSLWDFSASACIVAASGGWVSDIFGRPLDLNRPDSTFMNHRGVLYASDAVWAEEIVKLCTTILKE